MRRLILYCALLLSLHGPPTWAGTGGPWATPGATSNGVTMTQPGTKAGQPSGQTVAKPGEFNGNTFVYIGMLAGEQRKYWPDHSMPWLLGALVEHESCVSIKSTRCWSPRSQLKTAREEGAGLGQITRAYTSDGRIRFDSLGEMKRRYPMELSELSWGNVYDRPDLQLRVIVLMSRDMSAQLGGNLWFTDAAYNGGVGGVRSDIRACRLTPGCDTSQWFGHVELTCTKSKVALYGNRSACDINRHHVSDVFSKRKYTKIWP
jgi:hypothetical protein